MKPNTNALLRSEGTLGNERQAMTIDPGSLDRMMLMLTDLYSDQEGAVIREYPINALDSHRANGTTRPIEVTLPTATDPTFIVRDYGTGLSKQEVMEHFSKYGWSSKLETNDEVGMMGLGCKAALTYTRQFALSAIKDGLQIEVLVLRAVNDEGREVPSIEPVSVTPTDEPNGVTVYIPVDDVRNFNAKARHFFSYWKQGDVLVDGEEPAPPEGHWLDDDVLVQPDPHERNYYHASGTTVVMGNIPYPVSQEHDIARKTLSNAHVVIWVPIGAVDPTPPREALSYTPRTLETLQEARQFIWQRTLQDFQTRIDACETHTEAVQLHKKLQRRLMGTANLTYRGQRIPRMLTCPIDHWHYMPHIDRAGKEEAPAYIDLVQATTNTYIVGHATKVISRKQRDKIQGYIESLDKEAQPKLSRRLTVIHDLDWANGWLEGVRTIRWEEIEAVEVAKRAQQPKEERVYQLLQPNAWQDNPQGRSLKEKELPQGMDLVYVSPRAQSDDSYRSFRTAAQHSDFTVVLLHPRSFGRLKRTFPKALSARQAIYRELRRATQEMPYVIDELSSLLGGTFLRNLERMGSRNEAPKIEDKQLHALVNDIQSLRGRDDRGRLHVLRRAAEDLGIDYRHLRRDKAQFNKKDAQELRSRYPLLDLGGADGSDLIDYVNAMHSRRKDHS